mmetsp:Transcript_7650/g.17652  ORF Transcript_7650/g.17652 Transcript_7650/m.17652 type:complete len:111 (+) Transcript_7650:15-347(+)
MYCTRTTGHGGLEVFLMVLSPCGLQSVLNLSPNVLAIPFDGLDNFLVVFSQLFGHLTSMCTGLRAESRSNAVLSRLVGIETVTVRKLLIVVIVVSLSFALLVTVYLRNVL